MLTANKYILHVCTFPEDVGGFSSFVMNLPGAFGMGDTEGEAFKSAIDGAMCCIDEYVKSGNPIPWRDECKIPRNGRVKIFKVYMPGRSGE